MNKLTVDTQVLKKACATVKPAAYKRLSGGLPALTWVKVASDGRHAALTCTDLEVTATVDCQAPGEAWTFCVDVHALAASVPAGKGITTISEEEGYVTFSFGDGAPSVTLPAQPVDEYPRVRHLSAAGDDAAISVAPFADVLPAVGKDECRPILCQVACKGHEVAATDSYRLHVAQRPAGEMEIDCLVPGRLVGMVVKAAKAQKVERFSLWVEGAESTPQRVVTAQVGTLTLSVTICQGEFPPYEKLIPTTVPNILDLSQAGQVITASHKANSSLPIKFVIGNGKVHAIGGGGTVEMDLPMGQTTARDEVTVAYKPSYLSDALAGSDGLLGYTDPLKPALVARGGDVRLVMPVKVG